MMCHAGGDSSSKQDEPGSSQPPGQLPVGVHAITSDHYFEKSGEFTAWLQHKRAIFFNGESHQSAHQQSNTAWVSPTCSVPGLSHRAIFHHLSDRPVSDCSTIDCLVVDCPLSDFLLSDCCCYNKNCILTSRWH